MESLRTLQIATNKTQHEIIISLAQEVMNALGIGLSECIYQRALCQILRTHGYIVESEVVINVFFNNEAVGFIRADIIVDKTLCLELKTKATLTTSDKIQAATYLNHSRALQACILINFPSSNGSVKAEVVKRESL